MTFSRREFISGLTAVSCMAMLQSSAGLASFAPDPCATATLDSSYLRKKNLDQLGISFLGTFAIFVTKTNIVAYTPKVADDQGKLMHNYWLAKPKGQDRRASEFLFGLASPNNFQGIKTPVPPVLPKFVTNQANIPNSIDSQYNLVVPRPNSVNTPLHTIQLPLPDDIVLAGWSQRDGEKIFESNGVTDFCFLARDHIFVYNASRFDSTNLTFNGNKVKVGSDLNLRFLSEPVSDTQVVRECEGNDHIQRAMEVLANMLGMDKAALRVNLNYCNQQQFFGLTPKAMAGSAKVQKPKALDGGPAISASRFPACQTALVDATQ